MTVPLIIKPLFVIPAWSKQSPKDGETIPNFNLPKFVWIFSWTMIDAYRQINLDWASTNARHFSKVKQQTRRCLLVLIYYIFIFRVHFFLPPPSNDLSCLFLRSSNVKLNVVFEKRKFFSHRLRKKCVRWIWKTERQKAKAATRRWNPRRIFLMTFSLSRHFSPQGKLVKHFITTALVFAGT